MGKLLNSDEAHTELIGALQSVQTGVEGLTKSLGKINTMELDLAMQGYYLQDSQGLAQEVAKRLQPGDLVVTMGAGDIGALGPGIMGAMA